MTYAALALAVLAAWALAHRVPTARQRELAAGLMVLLAIDVVRIVNLPLAIDHVLSTAWYGVTAAIVWHELNPGRPDRWGLAIVFGSVAALPIGPAPAFWLALAVHVAAVVAYLVRRPIPGQVETVALLLAASSLADVAGPWLLGAPVRDWRIGQIPAIVTWLAIAGWEGRCWIRAGRSSG